jgi:hypothetical protein
MLPIVIYVALVTPVGVVASLRVNVAAGVVPSSELMVSVVVVIENSVRACWMRKMAGASVGAETSAA